jgi:hypothetical protein
MATLAQVTVRKWNGVEVNQQELISYHNVINFEELASGTLVKYQPIKRNIAAQVEIDEAYSAFDSGVRAQSLPFNIPVFVEILDGVAVNEERYILSSNIIRISQLSNGTHCRVLYDDDFNQHVATVQGTLASILAASDFPGSQGAIDLTVAEAQALIASSGLTPGVWYNITNAVGNTRQIQLIATDSNSLSSQGYTADFKIVNYYVSIDDMGGYVDEDLNSVDDMSVGLGSTIDAPGVVYNNEIRNSGATITGNVDADFTSNRIANVGVFTFDTTGGVEKVIDGNYFDGGEITLHSTADIRNSVFRLATALALNLEPGDDLDSCILEILTEDLDFQSGQAYTGKTYRPGFSDFDISYIITATTTIDLDGLKYIGIVNTTSTDPTETLDTFLNWPTNHPVRIYSEAGLVIRIAHGAGPNQPRLIGAQDFYLDGDTGDWIELTMVDGVLRQTGGYQYGAKTMVNVNAAPVAAVTATFAEVATFELPAGEWDVYGEVGFDAGGAGATIQQYAADILVGASSNFTISNRNLALAAGTPEIMPTKMIHLSLIGPVVISLQASVTFSAGAVDMYGTIRATRTTS